MPTAVIYQAVYGLMKASFSLPGIFMRELFDTCRIGKIFL